MKWSSCDGGYECGARWWLEEREDGYWFLHDRQESDGRTIIGTYQAPLSDAKVMAEEMIVARSLV